MPSAFLLEDALDDILIVVVIIGFFRKYQKNIASSRFLKKILFFVFVSECDGDLHNTHGVYFYVIS